MNKFKVMVLCIVLGVAVSLLAGCSEVSQAQISEHGYSVICLNGVQYWAAGHALAPKYSARSNTPDICS